MKIALIAHEQTSARTRRTNAYAVCNVHNVPLATNPAAARLLLAGLLSENKI